ncbi:MAG: nucleotidyltransferase family protein [Prevotella sp.]|nr:nucleotidyltransferase family protein [Prevotella sp.]
MSKTDCIGILRGCRSTLKSDYGIKSLRLFGSMARGEDHEGSDVDVFVDTETPNPFLLMEAKEYLEQRVGRSVDIIRNHSSLNPRLRRRIERDGVTIF